MKDFSKIENLINALNEIEGKAEYSFEVINEKGYIYAQLTTDLTWLYNMLWSKTRDFCIYMDKDKNEELYIYVLAL